MSGNSVEQLIFEKYDDLFNEESDDERRRRSRRSKKHEDDEWFATKRERLEKQRKDTPGGGTGRPRGRPKRKSLEGEISATTKVKRSYKRKSTGAMEESGSDGMSSPSDSSSASKKTPRKQPPVLPFSLLDLSKKFEGKIPSLKNAIKAEAINVKTSSSTPSQSIAAMLSAGPGKHERKQDKTNIWRNNSSSIQMPSMMNFMKPAITYPPVMEMVDDKATVINSIISGQYFEASGNGMGIGGGGGGNGGESGGSSRPSNYVTT